MLSISPGIVLWREKFSRAAQEKLQHEILALEKTAPFYRPVMPKTGKSFSVEETNLGTLGWVSDKTGYRYQPTHPVTGKAWPAMPQTLRDLWGEVTDAPQPECCLVNLYRAGAKMGLHQDRDENQNAPVVSISLGDDALFRIGGVARSGPTKSLRLTSGDVVMFGGVARLAFHGIDRIYPDTSTLIPGGGRINLTLRRVE